jgi:voltage-gated potassium channel
MSPKTKNGLLILTAIVVYILIALGLYLIEARDPNSNIKSFQDALWYSVITLTTIGYGDRFPVTGAGRILAMVFVLGSVGILGFVISQISSKIYKYMEDKKLGYMGTKMENHVVLIHWNTFARQILTEIVNAEKQAVVITEKKEDVDFIHEHYDQRFVFVLHSDVLDEQAFNRSNLSKATTILLNYEDDTDNLVNLIALKTPFPDLNYVISLNNPSLKKTFKQLGVTFTLAKNEVASKLIASYVFEPEVAKITEGLMSSGTSDLDMGLMQFKITAGNPYIQSKGLDSFIDLKNKHNVILVGISKPSPVSGEYELIKNPTNEHTIAENDYVIVLGNLKGKQELTTVFGVEEGI